MAIMIEIKEFNIILSYELFPFPQLQDNDVKIKNYFNLATDQTLQELIMFHIPTSNSNCSTSLDNHHQVRNL